MEIRGGRFLEEALMSWVGRGPRDRDGSGRRSRPLAFQVPVFEFPMTSAMTLGSRICTAAGRTLLSLVIMI